MYRSCILAALLLTGACWLTAVAQNPPPTDPDAKGSVSISVDVTNGVTTVTATRDAAAGWSVGTVFVYGLDPNGGYIYSAMVPFKGVDGDTPKTDKISLPLPNGTFIVWANHTVTENAPGTGSQKVGSALSTATVANSASTAVTPGGGITCSPVRITGGAGFQASGTYIILPGWSTDPNNSAINFYTVPTGGGLIRQMQVQGQVDKDGNRTWTTAPNTVYVPSQLKYNCLATFAIVKGGDAQGIGSAWKKDQ